MTRTDDGGRIEADGNRRKGLGGMVVSWANVVGVLSELRDGR
jgi:hypothetical protein